MTTDTTRSPCTEGTPLPEAAREAVVALMARSHIPGLVLAVVDRDQIRHVEAFGVADLATTAPVTPTTAFMWFSMSKIVTATATLRLVDDGLLDLDAPITDYVPEARSRWVTPRVRQLLDHTSGLGNPLPLRWVHSASAPAPDPAALLSRQLSRRRAFRQPPGKSARYTNLGYLALGQVVEAASGTRFEDYVRTAVLEPVGMGTTGFAYTDAPRAVGYLRTPAAVTPLLRRMLPPGVAGARVAGRLAFKPFYVDGPAYGGLIGDVLDAARFLRLHLGDGVIDGRRVLREDTARAMRAIDHPGTPFDHGLGWFRMPGTIRHPYVQHLGGGAGFRNVMRLYPEAGVGVVVMANTTGAYDTDPVLDHLAGLS